MLGPEKYEDAFAAFMDRNEYEAAQEALYKSIREAFRAGWLASEERYAETQKGK